MGIHEPVVKNVGLGHAPFNRAETPHWIRDRIKDLRHWWDGFTVHAMGTHEAPDRAKGPSFFHPLQPSFPAPAGLPKAAGSGGGSGGNGGGPGPGGGPPTRGIPFLLAQAVPPRPGPAPAQPGLNAPPTPTPQVPNLGPTTPAPVDAGVTRVGEEISQSELNDAILKVRRIYSEGERRGKLTQDIENPGSNVNDPNVVLSQARGLALQMRGTTSLQGDEDNLELALKQEKETKQAAANFLTKTPFADGVLDAKKAADQETQRNNDSKTLSARYVRTLSRDMVLAVAKPLLRVQGLPLSRLKQDLELVETQWTTLPFSSVERMTIQHGKDVIEDLENLHRDLAAWPELEAGQGDIVVDAEKAQALDKDLKKLFDDSWELDESKISLRTVLNVMAPVELAPTLDHPADRARLAEAIDEIQSEFYADPEFSRTLTAAQELRGRIRNISHRDIQAENRAEGLVLAAKNATRLEQKEQTEDSLRFVPRDPALEIRLRDRLDTLVPAIAHMADEGKWRLDSLRKGMPSDDWRVQGELILLALQAVARADEALNDPQQSYVDRQEIVIKALQAVDKALPAQQKFQSLFDPVRQADTYMLDIAAMPRSVSELSPDAQRNYQAFKAAHHSDGDDVWVLQEWYRDFHDQVTRSLPLALVRDALQATIDLGEDGGNVKNAIERHRANAGVLGNEQNMARAQDVQADKDRTLLERDFTVLQREVALTQHDTENITPETYLPTQTEVAEYTGRLEKLISARGDYARKTRDRAALNVLRKADTDLKALLAAIPPTTQELTPAQQLALEDILERIIPELPGMFEPAVHARGHSEKIDSLNEFKTKKDARLAGDFLTLTADMAMRYAGVPINRLAQGVTRDDTSVNQWLRVLGSAEGAPEAYSARLQFAEYLHSHGSVHGLRGAYNIGFQAIDILSMVLALNPEVFSANWDTMLGKNSGDSLFKIVQPSDRELIAAFGNMAVLTNGTAHEAVTTISGKLGRDSVEYFATKLPPRTFGKLDWRPSQSPAPDQTTPPGQPLNVYFDLGNGTVMEAASPHLSREEVQKTGGAWKPVANSVQMAGHFYTVIDQHRYEYVESKMALKERMAHFADLALGGAFLQEMVVGGLAKGNFFHDLILLASKDRAAQALGGFSVFFPMARAWNFAWRLHERIGYQIAVNSKEGAWVTGAAPQLEKIELGKGSNAIRDKKTGAIYFERTDEKRPDRSH